MPVYIRRTVTAETSKLNSQSSIANMSGRTHRTKKEGLENKEVGNNWAMTPTELKIASGHHW